MADSKLSSLSLGHHNIFQKGPWRNDPPYTQTFRECSQEDIRQHDQRLHSAFQNILAFLKNTERRGQPECNKICREILKN